MIIVMTNRALPSVPVSSPVDIDVSLLGNQFDTSADGSAGLHTGLLSKDSDVIHFYPRGMESVLFTNISQEDKDKPWVFFVHGFHQDPEENIKKSQNLSDHHNVNVVAFSWPSRPLNEALNGAEIAETIVKNLAKSALGVTSIWNLAADAGSRYLKDTLNNYKPALENAKASKNDLLEALRLVNEKMGLTDLPVLLVHSMGNFLLKNVLITSSELPMQFRNIILHQGDVNADDHDWVTKLKSNLSDSAKLYITINFHDFILWASSQRKTFLQLKKTERLGQTHRHYIIDNIHYLDFTYGESINNDHEFFKFSKDRTNEQVFECLDRIFSAQPDLLPAIEKQSNAGFTKMPTRVSLYCLENILDAAHGDTDEDGELNYIKSLDQFTDPLIPNDYDEEVDE